ncbi:hypothetical protein CAPTEDRAFT_212382 [Capitella teleta]|uniref:Transposable element P transposase-like RNase H domain-containing protein n=1 Tax=Capitella teleta TaxID=283909 RepID=R7UQB1_CAPTE|nr:hypothetical protein CAPTEDRAFT_212382 [Capitella teleta]|eukprot:ELU08719.1 hypothetical protein CAPTEDRAFT_212382 [Capitella teleta]
MADSSVIIDDLKRWKVPQLKAFGSDRGIRLDYETLRNRFKVVLREAGFCPKLERMITLQTQGLSKHEKLVTLFLDGMKLAPNLRFYKHSVTLVGCENLGKQGKSGKVSNEGVVVMCASIIEEAVILQRAGLTVVAVVMDQGRTQWRCKAFSYFASQDS